MRPGWDILTVIGEESVGGRVPVNYVSGSEKFGTIGAVGGKWDHIHPSEETYAAIKEGAGATKYVVSDVGDYTGVEHEATYPGCCTPAETDPVEWFVVAFICRKD